MANHMRTELVLGALAMTFAARIGLVHGIIFHSGQDTCAGSGERLDEHEAVPVPSTGRVRDSCDCDDEQCQGACRSGRLVADMGTSHRQTQF